LAKTAKFRVTKQANGYRIYNTEDVYGKKRHTLNVTYARANNQ